jgi:hypothetical protein
LFDDFTIYNAIVEKVASHHWFRPVLQEQIDIRARARSKIKA